MNEKLEWRTEQRLIGDLIPLDRNPFGKINREKKKRLENKMNRLGVFEIPTIDVNGDLLTFNKRRHILVALGREGEIIDVRVPNRPLTREERQEVILASNVHEGSWDKAILEEDFSNLDLKELGIDIEDLDIETKRLIEATNDEDRPNQLPENVDILQGDLFEFIGEGIKHRLFCGDSTNADHVARLLEGAVPILMVTDPPYGVNYDPTWRHKAGIINSSRKGSVANDDQADGKQTYALFTGDIAYVWHGGKHSNVVADNLQDCGFDLIAQIIWNKQQMVFGRGDYHWKHEPCWYAVREGKNHNWQGDRTQTTVWDIKNLLSATDDDSKQLHGTQKPIECMATPIRNHTAIGDSVYDPFGGSGTTMVAAHQLRRNCYMVELGIEYCYGIVQRMKKLDHSLKVTKNGVEI
jgi:DNA modification methylase